MHSAPCNSRHNALSFTLVIVHSNLSPNSPCTIVSVTQVTMHSSLCYPNHNTIIVSNGTIHSFLCYPSHHTHFIMLLKSQCTPHCFWISNAFLSPLPSHNALLFMLPMSQYNHLSAIQVTIYSSSCYPSYNILLSLLPKTQCTHLPVLQVTMHYLYVTQIIIRSSLCYPSHNALSLYVTQVTMHYSVCYPSHNALLSMLPKS